MRGKLALVAAVAGLATAVLGARAALADGGGSDFTACMSSHGVPGVTVDSAGRVHLTSGNPFADDYRKAVAACEHLLPSGTALPAAPTAPAAPTIEITVPKAPPAPRLDE